MVDGQSECEARMDKSRGKISKSFQYVKRVEEGKINIAHTPRAHSVEKYSFGTKGGLNASIRELNFILTCEIVIKHA